MDLLMMGVIHPPSFVCFFLFFSLYLYEWHRLIFGGGVMLGKGGGGTVFFSLTVNM